MATQQLSLEQKIAVASKLREQKAAAPPAQPSYPSWFKTEAVNVDPLNNPYFAPVTDGDGSSSLGNPGDPNNFYNFIGVPGMEGLGDISDRAVYGNRGMLQPGLPTPQNIVDLLKQNNYTLKEANREGVAVRYLEDAKGNYVGAPQVTNTSDPMFGMMASLVGALATGGIAGFAGLGPAATSMLTGAVGAANNTGLNGGSLGDIIKAGAKGAIPGAITGGLQSLNLSPAVAKAGSAALTTAAKGGNLRDILTNTAASGATSSLGNTEMFKGLAPELQRAVSSSLGGLIKGQDPKTALTTAVTAAAGGNPAARLALATILRQRRGG